MSCVGGVEVRALAEQEQKLLQTHQLGIPTPILLASAIIGGLLVSVACVKRYQVADPIRLEWAAVAETTQQSATHDSEDGDSTQVIGASLLDSDSLAELGDKLDAAGFGNLGSDSRFDPDEIVPVTRRWRLEFAPGLTEGQYAQQLDALGVELGVLASDGSVEYVSGIGGGTIERRKGTRQKEQRPYWTWDRGDLMRADQVLLNNAGVTIDDEVVLHFLSPETIESLGQLEAEFKGRDPEDIFQTRFALKRTFRGYVPFVSEQMER